MIIKGYPLDFSDALKELKKGKCVRNKGWNGENMYVCMQCPDKNSKMNMPYLYLKTPCGDLVPWQPSQYDLLSENWEVVDSI